LNEKDESNGFKRNLAPIEPPMPYNGKERVLGIMKEYIF